VTVPVSARVAAAAPVIASKGILRTLLITPVVQLSCLLHGAQTTVGRRRRQQPVVTLTLTMMSHSPTLYHYRWCITIMVRTFDSWSRGREFDSRSGRYQVVTQGGHSPGKPGKVREFKSGQGKVRENRKSQGKCVLACI